MSSSPAPINYRLPLKRHRNELFRAIENSGWDALDFDLIEEEIRSHSGKLLVHTVIYRPENRFFYRMGVNVVTGHRSSSLSPGSKVLHETTTHSSIEAQIAWIPNWLS